MLDDLLDSWQINNRIHLYLLESISEEALPSVPTGMKGRSVASIFAHMHNVRLMWLEPIDSKLMDNVQKIPTRTNADKATLAHDMLCDALIASADALAQGIQARVDNGKTSIFKPHVAGFVSYLISHEGYHRGEICMTLTSAGHKLPDDVLGKLWEWQKY